MNLLFFLTFFTFTQAEKIIIKNVKCNCFCDSCSCDVPFLNNFFQEKSKSPMSISVFVDSPGLLIYFSFFSFQQSFQRKIFAQKYPTLLKMYFLSLNLASDQGQNQIF